MRRDRGLDLVRCDGLRAAALLVPLLVGLALPACSKPAAARATVHLRAIDGSLERLVAAAGRGREALQAAAKDEAKALDTAVAALGALSAEVRERGEAGASEALADEARAALPSMRRRLVALMGSLRSADGLDAVATQAAALGEALPTAVAEATSADGVIRAADLAAVATLAPTLAQLGKPGALGGPIPSGRVDAPDGPADTAAWLRFARGAQIFLRGYGPDSGLGPHFNDTACSNCHATPTLGGWGGVPHGAKFRENPDDPREIMGVPKFHIPGVEPMPLPEGATVLIRRAPPLYGLGFIDSIPPEQVEKAAAANAQRTDGVRGIANTRVGQIARFGAKSHELTMANFVSAALKDEMGITSAAHRCENQLEDDDKVPDPEISGDDFDLLVDYVRMLAPPPRAPMDDEARAGEALFAQLGCDGCHKPTFAGVTGAYTDLLVHKMGAQLDNGLPEQLADGDAWRTAPLWGLRYRPRFLHDDSAGTIREAIDKHGGEAEHSAAGWRKLSERDKARLLAFLATI